jgi:hypothetical protein
MAGCESIDIPLILLDTRLRDAGFLCLINRQDSLNVKTLA